MQAYLAAGRLKLAVRTFNWLKPIYTRRFGRRQGGMGRLATWNRPGGPPRQMLKEGVERKKGPWALSWGGRALLG